MARHSCNTFVHPKGISPRLECHLIALNKCPSIKAIGICETPRRIIAKSVLFVTRGDLQDTADSKQLYADKIADIEAAVHAMRSFVTKEDTKAVLLVYATNAFNSLNRQISHCNVQLPCPSLANIFINSFREPSELLVDGEVL